MIWCYKLLSNYNKNENHHESLQYEIKNASLPDTSIKTVGGFPEHALNKHFFLENNKMGLRSMGFHEGRSGYIIGLSFIDSSKERHPVGMNNQYLISKEHSFGLPTAVKGRWINNILHIDYNRLCRIENYTFSISFLGDNLIQLTVTEDSKEINETITGKTFTVYK